MIDSYEYMIVSGETEAFEEIALHECGWCKSHVESARNLRAAGGWVEKAGLQIVELQEPFSIPEHEETWNSDVTLQQDELVGYNGTKVGSDSARETRLRFQIRFVNGQWNVWKVLSVD